MDDHSKYGEVFNITYATFQEDWFSPRDELFLKMGENHLDNAKEKVHLSPIYTRWNSLCYSIQTTRMVDVDNTMTRFILKTSDSKVLPKVKIFFTSEDNLYGVINSNWRDGKAYSIEPSGGDLKEIYLKAEKKINLDCSETSFYEYVASKLPESSLEGCWTFQSSANRCKYVSTSFFLNKGWQNEGEGLDSIQYCCSLE